MNKMQFENGTLVSPAKVVIDGVEHEVTPAVYEGNTPFSAENINKMQDNMEEAIPEIVDDLITEDTTKALSAKQGKELAIMVDEISVAIYGTGDEKGLIDPNTTLENLILTQHANGPDGGTSFYYIRTIFYTGKAVENNRCQIAQGYGTNEYYTRYCRGDSWSAWKPVGHTEIITGEEVTTNEYLDGSRVFTKRIVVTTAITGGTRLTVPHEITDAGSVWIDLSNSYIQNRDDNTTLALPIVYYDNQSNSMQVTADLTNIYIDAGGGWNTRWRKVITLKYTK